ncbi:MAG: AI-2E family transporter [Beijerinckiaceae bacterium]
MFNPSFKFIWDRNTAETEVDEAPHELQGAHVEAAGHDPLTRYAILGIFLMMGVAALWVTRIISIPLVAGTMLGIVLGPLVDRFVRFGAPQAVAATTLTFVVLVAFTAITALIAAPIAIWADQLPALAAALRAKLSGLLESIRQIEGLAGALSPARGPTVSLAESSAVGDIAASSTVFASGLLLFFATLFAYLATRRHLKARVLRFCLGRNARQSAGRFFHEIEARMAVYFGMVTLINVGVGLVTWFIAWQAGLPLAGIWGVVAFVLNYVAFIGPLIVTALLFASGLIEATSIWSAVLPAAAYYLIHLIEGNIVTPMVVGRRLTLSPFLVLLSFIFWLWLWGPIGAILSTPILILITLAAELQSAYRAAQAADATSAAIEGTALDVSSPGV